MPANHNEQGPAMQNVVDPNYSEPSISSLGSFRTLVDRLSNPSSHVLIENVFLRLLGLTYLAAFGSLLPQLIPLLGSNGIVPAKRFLDSFRPEMAPSLVFSIPTMFWISAADWVLRAA